MVWILKLKCFEQFSFVLCRHDSVLDCIWASNTLRLFFLKRLGSSVFLQLHWATRCSDNKHWANSLLSITDNFNSLSCSEFSSKSYFSKIKKTLFLKENQLFRITPTKEILTSTTFDESAVDTFALYVLLTNFCSWKIVVKKPHSTKSPAQRNLHALYHVNVVAN